MNLTIKCPCCCNKVDKYDICEVCGWQNSGPGERDTDPRGPNKVSLSEARKLYEQNKRNI